MTEGELWDLWESVIDVDVGVNPCPYGRAVIEKVAEILACEVECDIFERHIAPVFEKLRRTV